MLLHELLKSFDPCVSLDQIRNENVNGVKEDSRHVMPGDLFVARAGAKANGREFLAAAQKLGAIAAVVGERDDQCSLPQIVAADPGGAVSQLAHIFYGRPSRAMRVLGITGTNGKTTTAYLVRHLLAKVNQPCGLIGTVQIDDGRRTQEAAMTTPSATEVAALLSDMRDNGCTACAMEVSSHALDQGRTAAVTFAGAAFTNLTGDHLDYHKTMQQYADAKAKLFEMLDEKSVAVVNAGSDWTERIVRNCKARIVRFGFETPAEYRAEDVAITSEGSRFLLAGPDGVWPATMGLIGRHNIENALAAAALVGEAFGLSVRQISAGLADAAGAPGRLQAVRAGQSFTVLVDYAHTDDALANVLASLGPLARGKLRVLFGCGGDRDKTKRPRMAAIAQQLADVVYVTSDNPRTEMPLAIIADIMAGFTDDYQSRVIVEPERRAAIEQLLADAQSGDIVLIAGKGHENYQIVGSAKQHFDDVEEVVRVLSARTRAA